MDLTEYLHRRGATLTDLDIGVGKALGRSGEDVLFASGSLVEDLGNPHSDLDLYLISARTDVPCDIHVLPLGSVTVDVAVMRPDELDRLLARFEEYTRQERDTGEAWKFSPDERLLLHRLVVGRAIWRPDTLGALQARINPIALASHKLNYALHAAKRLQLDLEGCRVAGDWQTMLLAAQDLLNQTIDGLLAGYVKTNPTEKWRAQLLKRLPSNWDLQIPGRVSGRPALDHYLVLNRLPSFFDAASVYDYALQIAAFSRRIFPWAGWKLCSFGRTESSFGSLYDKAPARKAAEVCEEKLCHLELDVLFVYSEEKFQARRLSTTDGAFDLSAEAVNILCHFDGVSDQETAEKADGRCESMPLCDAHSFIASAGFRARGMVDDDTIGKLLKRS
ncbi:hypothetical protein QA649_02575 [Bradyrhizobium sp. CB1717]|uniref:hypothetical protein n=1 Tax=Bradyrhizobium sp. CB1717 TaxID=3039154 RepID=UPI0024B1E3A8|nr:hypothetical protein [Bradyrhizobium sp. CB1717]WFU25150.1 hypothetical protein QA649_02575 [Bradyrhizobium sp. CB1717]